MGPLKAFIELAVKDSDLIRLFPFMSHESLRFSRCTGYPYTTDMPIVVPIENGLFEIRTTRFHLLGTGTASEALIIVKAHMPRNMKPATKGTSEDLQ